MMEHVRWLVGTLIALAGLVIALLAWQFPKERQAAPAASSSSPAATSSSRTTPKSAVKNVALTRVRVGECLSGPSLVKMIATNFKDWPDSAEVVPCNASHIAEVFFAGTDLRRSQVSSKTDCDDAYRSYIGLSSNYSKYSWWSQWSQTSNGYSLQCFVYYQIWVKPKYKSLDRSLKGIKK